MELDRRSPGRRNRRAFLTVAAGSSVAAALGPDRLASAVLRPAAVQPSQGAAPGPGAAAPSLIRPAVAAARLSAAQAREADAYTLGVQAVLWGMQWVKAAQTLQASSSPALGARLGVPDASALGVNLWHHNRTLVTHEVRFIETPNAETLNSWVVVDLRDGPIVVVHPDLGERYFRTSVWELRGDTHTISQKKDGGSPPPYALVPHGWNGTLPEGLRAMRMHSRYVVLAPHIAVYGPADVANVHALQDGLKAVS